MGMLTLGELAGGCCGCFLGGGWGRCGAYISEGGWES